MQTISGKLRLLGVDTTKKIGRPVCLSEVSVMILFVVVVVSLDREAVNKKGSSCHDSVVTEPFLSPCFAASLFLHNNNDNFNDRFHGTEKLVGTVRRSRSEKISGFLLPMLDCCAARCMFSKVEYLSIAE